MPPTSWWTIDEALRLIELHDRTGGHPTAANLEDLRELLLELADPRYREDISYRSIGSIRSHLSWVEHLARQDPVARNAPKAFRDAWRLHRPTPWIPEESVLLKGYASDRRALIRVLVQLRATVAELVGSHEYLPEPLQASYTAAWHDIEDRGYIDQAIGALRGPAVDDLLAVHGLVGPQRTAKAESVDVADRERRNRGGWGPLKALLGYFDSILGSLTSVFPWLGAVLEFKEITEASAELADQTSPPPPG